MERAIITANIIITAALLHKFISIAKIIVIYPGPHQATIDWVPEGTVQISKVQGNNVEFQSSVYSIQVAQLQLSIEERFRLILLQ